MGQIKNTTVHTWIRFIIRRRAQLCKQQAKPIQGCDRPVRRVPGGFSLAAGRRGCYVEFIQQVFVERMQCMGLAGRVRLRQQVQVAGRHCMREGTALRGGSEWQSVPGGQDSASADR